MNIFAKECDCLSENEMPLLGDIPYFYQNAIQKWVKTASIDEIKEYLVLNEYGRGTFYYKDDFDKFYSSILEKYKNIFNIDINSVNYEIIHAICLADFGNERKGLLKELGFNSVTQN